MARMLSREAPTKVGGDLSFADFYTLIFASSNESTSPMINVSVEFPIDANW
jgi:hypothetical protein